MVALSEPLPTLEANVRFILEGIMLPCIASFGILGKDRLVFSFCVLENQYFQETVSVFSYSSTSTWSSDQVTRLLLIYRSFVALSCDLLELLFAITKEMFEMFSFHFLNISSFQKTFKFSDPEAQVLKRGLESSIHCWFI